MIYYYALLTVLSFAHYPRTPRSTVEIHRIHTGNPGYCDSRHGPHRRENLSDETDAFFGAQIAGARQRTDEREVFGSIHAQSAMAEALKILHHQPCPGQQNECQGDLSDNEAFQKPASPAGRCARSLLDR